jgi:hypothetical protein
MEVFSAAERGAGWSFIVTGGDVTASRTRTPRVPDRSKPSGSGEIVGAGMGTRIEQERLVQGMRRAGAGCSSGDCTESPMTRASSRAKLKEGSDCAVTR